MSDTVKDWRWVVAELKLSRISQEKSIAEAELEIARAVATIDRSLKNIDAHEKELIKTNAKIASLETAHGKLGSIRQIAAEAISKASGVEAVTAGLPTGDAVEGVLAGG